MITVDELLLSNGEIAIVADNGELVAWIPAHFDNDGKQAVVKNGYRIITSIVDADDTLRDTLRVLNGGKPK